MERNRIEMGKCQYTCESCEKGKIEMKLRKSDIDKILRAFRAYKFDGQKLDDLRDANKYCQRAVDGTEIWWGDLADICKVVTYRKKSNEDCYHILEILGIEVVEDGK